MMYFNKILLFRWLDLNARLLAFDERAARLCCVPVHALIFVGLFALLEFHSAVRVIDNIARPHPLRLGMLQQSVD